jgi:hypothetical protein
MDKSQITKARRSLDVEDELDHRRRGYRQAYREENHPLPRSNLAFGERQNRERKERSLSPYSKRLALTQSMNM